MPKKNLRLIPNSIKMKLKGINGPVIAAVSKVYSAKQISDGDLRHLGVTYSKDEIQFQPTIIPSAEQGRFSSKNINGEEIVRTDLRKETHYNAIESPNWGDPWNGTHTVYLPYERYPRDFISPRLLRLKITVPKNEPGQSSYVIIFAVDQVLDPKGRTFDDDLLFCLNLLQENVAACGVQSSNASVADYLQTLRVSWEVLPPGTREDALVRLFRARTPSDQEKAAVEERYDFLIRLKPAKLIYGTSGLERYFGGLIKDDLVVFENIQYGNAIYIMFDNWRELSQRSRTELLSGRFGKNFERVMHGSGWKGRVKQVIKERTEKKP